MLGEFATIWCISSSCLDIRKSNTGPPHNQIKLSGKGEAEFLFSSETEIFPVNWFSWPSGKFFGARQLISHGSITALKQSERETVKTKVA